MSPPDNEIRPSAAATGADRTDDEKVSTTVPQTSTSLEISRAAQAYIGRGWPVFVLSATKKPLQNCPECDPRKGNKRYVQHEIGTCGHLTCHGFYAATTDPVRVAAMLRQEPRGMLAIRTGKPSGLVVVDVDPRHGGNSTLATLDAEQQLLGTLMVVTGSGGLHLVYAHPGGHVPCSQNRLGPGIDVKADGGYVVAAPSRHPATGDPYRWCPATAWRDDPTPLDARLRGLLVPAARPAPDRHEDSPHGDPYKRMRGPLRRLLEAPEGERNGMLFKAAKMTGKLHAAGEVDLAGAVALLQDAALRRGLTASETGDEHRGTIASGLNAARRSA